MSASLSSKATWLQSTISDLLVSPYIHFRAPAGLGIHMGHGPIDLFSTKFNNNFTPDVKATVAGNTVNRDELKQMLLGLQQHYSPDNVKFEIPATEASADSNTVYVKFTGQSKVKGPYEVAIDANVSETEGQKKISSIKLDGDPALFEQKSHDKSEL
ncbi:hypothetical protein M422DRAFT_273116 [Sphaerobolus stellatus SS14]|uniref:Uncharacterized protein n=1 Tax=Sphaerobolus stellatus (strain SS14) TaxID=990650 RepID=A0A0C9UKY7_SPHS4|nr:hypothetical protein M422DRAFT_273116 [Sphaerobolus stellatus SS14]